MSRPEFYDREGRPLTTCQWARLMERPFDEYRRVAQTDVGADVLVSTVWLGIDYSFGLGPPLIFETMIFNGSWEGQDCWRWPTEEAALAGHDQAVEWMRFQVAHEAM